MKLPTSVVDVYHDGEIDTNPTANPHLNDLVAMRCSRRQTMMGGLSAMTAAVFGGMLLSGCDEDDSRQGLDVGAGGTAQASAGRTVTLTGTISGTSSSVSWTQVSGPAVTLTGATTATAAGSRPTRR